MLGPENITFQSFLSKNRFKKAPFLCLNRCEALSQGINHNTSPSFISNTVTTISSPSHGSTLKLENSYKSVRCSSENERFIINPWSKCRFLTKALTRLHNFNQTNQSQNFFFHSLKKHSASIRSLAIMSKSKQSPNAYCRKAHSSRN